MKRLSQNFVLGKVVPPGASPRRDRLPGSPGRHPRGGSCSDSRGCSRGAARNLDFAPEIGLPRLCASVCHKINAWRTQRTRQVPHIPTKSGWRKLCVAPNARWKREKFRSAPSSCAMAGLWGADGIRTSLMRIHPLTQKFLRCEKRVHPLVTIAWETAASLLQLSRVRCAPERWFMLASSA